MGEGRDDEEEEEDRHVAREAARKGRGGVRTTPRGRVGLVKRSAPCSASLGARPRGDNTTSDRCRHDDWVWGGGALLVSLMCFTLGMDIFIYTYIIHIYTYL